MCNHVDVGIHVAQAGLVDLDNTELVGVTGQGGADLSLTLSINHQYANDMSLNTISTDQWCRCKWASYCH